MLRFWRYLGAAKVRFEWETIDVAGIPLPWRVSCQANAAARVGATLLILVALGGAALALRC